MKLFKRKSRDWNTTGTPKLHSKIEFVHLGSIFKVKFIGLERNWIDLQWKVKGDFFLEHRTWLVNASKVQKWRYR